MHRTFSCGKLKSFSQFDIYQSCVKNLRKLIVSQFDDLQEWFSRFLSTNWQIIHLNSAQLSTRQKLPLRKWIQSISFKLHTQKTLKMQKLALSFASILLQFSWLPLILTTHRSQRKRTQSKPLINVILWIFWNFKIFIKPNKIDDFIQTLIFFKDQISVKELFNFHHNLNLRISSN